uniref:Biphenyl hydrolase like n=1 Tax=Mus musculus TaxID=10090 RepID=A0A1Y7VNX0_MOUSE
MATATVRPAAQRLRLLLSPLKSRICVAERPILHLSFRA